MLLVLLINHLENTLFPIPGNINGFEVGNTLGNPGLQPEITTEFEIGSDLRFLNHRLISRRYLLST